MTSKSELQATIDRLIAEGDVMRNAISTHVCATATLAFTSDVAEGRSDVKPWPMDGNEISGDFVPAAEVVEFWTGKSDAESPTVDQHQTHTVTIKRNDYGKWQALIDEGVIIDEGATTSEEPKSVAEGFNQLREFLTSAPSVSDIYDELKSERGPDVPRVPQSEDYLLAGVLSTIWPLSQRHPNDALHLAIYLRDHLNVEPS